MACVVDVCCCGVTEIDEIYTIQSTAELEQFLKDKELYSGLVFATTVKGRDRYELPEKALAECGFTMTPFFNPNTGNNLRFWTKVLRKER